MDEKTDTKVDNEVPSVNKPVVQDKMILVDAQILVDAANVIRNDYGKPIDTYNGLMNVLMKSGKLQK